MSDQRKWKCCSCDGISIESDLLHATNPFDETMTIDGCPICKDVVGFTEICDEPNCIRDATCGFPTAGGYRRTCSDHMRAAEKSVQLTGLNVCNCGAGFDNYDYPHLVGCPARPATNASR